METLKFYKNWNNKLNCDCFTTIRPANFRKYYKGAEFRIVLLEKNEETFMGNASIIEVGTTVLNSLKDYHFYLDTGYDKEKAIKIFFNMYKNNPKVDVDGHFNVILLKKTSTNTSSNSTTTPEPKFSNYLTSCPQCQAPWDHKQIELQSCNVCSYPEFNDNY